MTKRQFIAALKKLGISQRSFARRIGVNERTVRRWTAGKSKIPRYAELLLKGQTI